MPTILNVPLAGALASQLGAVFQFRPERPRSLSLQANFTRVGGGTSMDAYVQSTLDGGLTWFDIAEFSFTTTSGLKIANLSSLTPVTTVYTPTDGALSANTVKDGLIGTKIRVKWTSVGTYSGASGLLIDANCDGMLVAA